MNDENKKYYIMPQQEDYFDSSIYYDENQALIVPKEDFKDRFVPIMTMVTQHVRPGCVRLR